MLCPVRPGSQYFACVVLQLEVNVNACCNARIEKNSIPGLRCIAMRVQINLYALLVATQHKQNIVNQALVGTHLNSTNHANFPIPSVV